MNWKLLRRRSRRRLDETLAKTIWLAAIFLLVIPTYLTSVARASAGDLVAGFGLGGKVITDFSGNIDTAGAVAVYPDGRIVVAGTSELTNSIFETDIALARYNPDGSLDQTFGNGGLVTTDFNENENAAAVVIQPDGKIVVAGSISHSTGHDYFLVIRYNEDGTLDSSFGQDGLVTTDFYNSSASAADLVITPNGEIVVGGMVFWTEPGNYWHIQDIDFAIARYKPNGHLDETFGSGGKVVAGSTTVWEFVSAIVVNAKGEIVLAGQANTKPGILNYDFHLARFDRDGNVDASFGLNGWVITDFSVVDWLGDIALTPQGEIIAVGYAEPSPGKFDFVVARYDRHGNLDPSFGTAGRVITDFWMRDDLAFAVAVRPNGKIVVAGTSGFVTDSHQNDFALARYERDGTLDQSFGSGGLVTTDFSGHTDEVAAVTILPSGRIIVAGRTWDARNQPFSPSRDFAVAEYEGK